jgi:serine protease Do
MKFNGTEVQNSEQLRNLVAEAEPGSKATMTVQRDGKTLDLTVTLGERPKNLASRGSEEETPEKTTNKQFGLSVENLTPQVARALGYKGDAGVVVTAVTPESAADDAGIRKNDLIKEVNRVPVQSVEEFQKALEQSGRKHDIALLVRRGDNTFFVALQATS